MPTYPLRIPPYDEASIPPQADHERLYLGLWFGLAAMWIVLSASFLFYVWR